MDFTKVGRVGLLSAEGKKRNLCLYEIVFFPPQSKVGILPLTFLFLCCNLALLHSIAGFSLSLSLSLCLSFSLSLSSDAAAVETVSNDIKRATITR
jgi:hypothetical protein